jgi:hypothetical protein
MSTGSGGWSKLGSSGALPSSSIGGSLTQSMAANKTWFSSQPVSWESHFPLTINGSSRTFKETYLSKLVRDQEELEILVEEQPSVKEAYENLQILIKLYRSEDEPQE